MTGKSCPLTRRLLCPGSLLSSNAKLLPELRHLRLITQNQRMLLLLMSLCSCSLPVQWGSAAASLPRH